MTHLRLVSDEVTHADAPRVTKVEFANTLRGLACLCVVFAHYAGVFWEAPTAVATLTGTADYAVGPERMPAINWLDNAIPHLQWGPFGVAVFFLISGFVIPFSLARNTAGQFMVNRMLRIWPTYVCGFAFTLAMIALGSWSYGNSVPFSVNEALIHTVPGLRDLLGSRNIDGIIWTLEIEVKFYLLCALAAPWLRQYSTKVFWVPMGIGCLALIGSTQVANLPPMLAQCTTTYINMSQYLVFMTIGIALHYAHEDRLGGKQLMAWVGTLAVMVCLIWSHSPYKETFPQAWNYALALCLFAWAMSYPGWLKPNRILNWFAAISYPLYVVHGVAGYVILRWLFAAELSPMLSIVLTTAIMCGVAWGLHVLVEKPTQAFGKRLAARWTARPNPSDERMAA